MKKSFLIMSICLLTYCNRSNAQVQSGINGISIKENAFTEVEGDPYLINGWNGGAVTLKDNKSIIATLKFDVYTNHLLFQGPMGTPMQLRDSAKSCTLNVANTDLSDISPFVFVTGYPPYGQRKTNSWYQLIADGKVSLLKYYKKIIKEDWEFTSSTVTKSFLSYKYYYIFKDNHLTEVQRSKKAILKVLNGHEEEVKNYLKANHINFDSDTDLQTFFTWYNSLS
jgi:hypothetical protein